MRRGDGPREIRQRCKVAAEAQKKRKNKGEKQENKHKKRAKRVRRKTAKSVDARLVRREEAVAAAGCETRVLCKIQQDT